MVELTQDDLERNAAALGQALMARGWMLVAAESCTGGWAAQAITAVPGSSAWFDRGFVTYSNAAKTEQLGVPEVTLDAQGAVSEATVCAMAEGALRHSHAQAAFAISGIAGPGGGSAFKPVGTVCFAWAVTGQPVIANTRHFDGDRRLVRMHAVEYALSEMRAILATMP